MKATDQRRGGEEEEILARLFLRVVRVIVREWSVTMVVDQATTGTMTTPTTTTTTDFTLNVNVRGPMPLDVLLAPMAALVRCFDR